MSLVNCSLKWAYTSCSIFTWGELTPTWTETSSNRQPTFWHSGKSQLVYQSSGAPWWLIRQDIDGHTYAQIILWKTIVLCFDIGFQGSRNGWCGEADRSFPPFILSIVQTIINSKIFMFRISETPLSMSWSRDTKSLDIRFLWQPFDGLKEWVEDEISFIYVLRARSRTVLP